MGLKKGEGVRDRMDELKPVLVDRHNAWEEGRVQIASPRASRPPPSSYDADRRQRNQAPHRRSSRDDQQPQSEEKRISYPDLSADKHRYNELTVPHPVPRNHHRDSILQRQKEADEEYRTARNATALSNNPSPYAYSSHSPMPSPGAVTPQRSTSHTSSNGTDTFDPPPLLPLESPFRRYDDDSTDAEKDDDRLYKRVAEKLTIGRDDPTSLSFGG